MTVEERGDDAAVQDVLGPGIEWWAGLPIADGLFAVLVALNLQSALVPGATAPTVVVGEHVLDRD
jgi:hypothetical protein